MNASQQNKTLLNEINSYQSKIENYQSNILTYQKTITELRLKLQESQNLLMSNSE